VAGLELAGRDAAAARDLLRRLEVAQQLHIADRTRLREELDDERTPNIAATREPPPQTTQPLQQQQPQPEGSGSGEDKKSSD
jgi:hypothetical protein